MNVSNGTDGSGGGSWADWAGMWRTLAHLLHLSRYAILDRTACSNEDGCCGRITRSLYGEREVSRRCRARSDGQSRRQSQQGSIDARGPQSQYSGTCRIGPTIPSEDNMLDVRTRPPMYHIVCYRFTVYDCRSTRRIVYTSTQETCLAWLMVMHRSRPRSRGGLDALQVLEPYRRRPKRGPVFIRNQPLYLLYTVLNLGWWWCEQGMQCMCMSKIY